MHEIYIHGFPAESRRKRRVSVAVTDCSEAHEAGSREARSGSRTTTAAVEIYAWGSDRGADGCRFEEKTPCRIGRTHRQREYAASRRRTVRELEHETIYS